MLPAHRFAQGGGAAFIRLVSCLILPLLAAPWLSAPARPAIAQEMNLLYEENFDDGRADGWDLPDSVEGAWWVEGGQLIGSGHVFAELPGPEWGAGQHRLEFDLGGLGVNNGLHVNVHHSASGRYMVGFRQVDDNHLYIYLERNLWDQPSQPLASNADNLFEYRDFDTYRVTIYFGDGHLSVYLEKPGQEIGLSLISAYDPQPLPPGWISFESLMNMPVRLDNLVVQGPGLPLVFSPFPEPPFIPQTQEPEQPEPKPEQPQVTEQPGPEPQPPSATIPEFRQCQGESLLYAEAFEDGQAQDWNLVGNWRVGDGLLRGEGHDIINYYAGWEDLTLYVVYSLPPGDEAFHICARKSGTGRYFAGVSTQGLYLSRQEGWQAGQEDFSDLAGIELQTDPDIWHTLAFSIHGRSIQVALDGNVQLEAQDNHPLPAGGIALETLGPNGVVIEEVWVCGTPPEQPRETEPLAPRETEPPAPPPDDEPPAPQALPDLVVADIQAHQYDAAARTQTLLVSVANVGDLTTGANQVRIQIPGGQALFYDVPRLDPYKSSTLLVQLKIPPELIGNAASVEARVDPNNRIREQDEQNNVRLSAAIDFLPPRSKPCWLCIIAIAVGVMVTILIGRSIWRRLRRGRGPERPGKEPQGLPPVLPPVRLLDVWLTEGVSGKGARLKDDRPLVAGAEYCLHAQVLSHEAQPKGRSRPQAAGAPLALHAVVFSPETDFPVRERRLELSLPPGGSSQPVFWPFRPGGPGLRRARLCLYYGNLLLQSAYVEATVSASRGERRSPTAGALRRMLDYVASASLSGLERLPQPSVSIFTNQADGGMGWIGVYAGGEPASGLSGGLLRMVDPERLRWRAGPARQRLLEIEEAYTFAQKTPAGRFSRLEQDLALLACSGWSLYDELFLRSSQVSRQDLARFDQALRPPGLVAIERCRGESSTLPWAAIYDLEVDTGKPDQLRLCPVFKAELQAHWSPDLAQYDPHHDWLDNPQGCRQNPCCPLAGEDEQITLLTICPFGFWGFRHQISQPLQSVSPTPVGQVPEEIARAGEYEGVSSFDSTIYLRRGQNERLKLAIGVHPSLAQAERLPVDITALQPDELEIRFESARDRVLELLKQGGFHFYILYCHGDCDEREQKFKLVFGPLQDERPISCENLNPLKITWPEQPKPLVLLNGCETVAVTPEIAHGLLDRLHELGAAGVVGTEIQVYPSLAYPFGLEILERFLCGASLGEAFLEERKELLRQLNPLGLAYTYYAPAALHVHVEGACGWCAAHKVRPR